MPTITFVNEKKELQVAEGANLRKEALAAGIKLYDGINGFGAGVNSVVNCHGWGVCGTCKVKITKGIENAEPMGMVEKATFKYIPGPSVFSYLGNEDTMRLACKVTVMGDMTVETRPPLDLFGDSFFS